MEEHCSEPGLPARGDYVIVAGALSQVSQSMRTARRTSASHVISVPGDSCACCSWCQQSTADTLCLNKKDPDIIDCNLKKDYQILNCFLFDYSWHNWASPHPNSASTLPGKSCTSEICLYALKWTKSVNKFHPSGSMAPTALTSVRSITMFAVSCSSEPTRRRLGMLTNSRSNWLNVDWSMGHNIFDTAINNWINCQPEWQKSGQNVLCVCYFNEVIMQCLE